jgi:hypothetical protein
MRLVCHARKFNARSLRQMTDRDPNGLPASASPVILETGGSLLARTELFRI